MAQVTRYGGLSRGWVTIYRRATQMGRSATPKQADPEMLNFIVGTAILFDRRVWF